MSLQRNERWMLPSATMALALLLTSCSGGANDASAEECVLKSELSGCQAHDGELLLRLSSSDDRGLGLALESISKTNAVDKRFAYTNAAGVGNLTLIFVNGTGRSFPGCGGFVDPAPDYDEELRLEAGERRESDHSLLLLKEVYCLLPGQYTVSAVYADRHGNHAVSNVVPIEIEGSVD